MVFEILGTPRGKGRPRFKRMGKFTATYTDSQTANYEDSVRWEYLAAAKGKVFDGPIQMNIVVYHEIPKSASPTKAGRMRQGLILPTKKPDADNVAKIIADALNKVAYKDDTQIVNLSVIKSYADMPKTVVEILEIEQ